MVESMYQSIQTILKTIRSRAVTIPLLRTQDWWMGKAIPYLAIATLSIVKYQPSVTTSSLLIQLAVFLVVVFCIASFGFLLNDYCDQSQDLLSGRSTPVAGVDRRLVIALMVLLLGTSLVLLFQLPGGLLASYIVIAEYLLFLLYSVKPVRLKERGFLGPLADSLYGHVFPSVTSWIVVASPTDYLEFNFLLPLLFLTFWQLPLGLRHILSHQLECYDSDSRAGEQSFVAVRGRESAGLIVFRYLVPIEAVGLSLFLLSALPYSWAALLGVCLLAIRRCMPQISLAPASKQHEITIFAKPKRSLAWKVLSKFFHGWFSMLTVVGIIIMDWSRWPLLLGYFLLSPLNAITQISLLLEDVFAKPKSHGSARL